MQFEKILVVDDEAIQREVLAEIVKQTSPNTEVFTAHNGEEAYDLMRKVLFGKLNAAFSVRLKRVFRST